MNFEESLRNIDASKLCYNTDGLVVTKCITARPFVLFGDDRRLIADVARKCCGN